jgi:endonuclease/exonuclease/phosphatase family metal-dependent hydrolase
VTNVYALSDHSLTSEFTAEMVALLPLITGSWLYLGDFNLLRHPSEKNNSNFHQNLADAFNAMINSLALFELPLLDRRFTWSNGQDTPVLPRLDRAFFNQDWNLAFPNSSLVSHHRPTSDHFPIVVTAATSIPSPVVFRFENSWLLDAAFLPTTIPAWSRPVPDRNAAA